ncbi:MAG: hypothetical protein WBN90_13850 [Gammaproteobacteria bacterium]
MIRKILGYIAGGAYLIAIYLMLRNGFGNEATTAGFGFIVFLVIATMSATIGNALGEEFGND